MNASLFPTTIAGSLPKPSWLAETLRLWPEWRLEADELNQAKRDAILVAIYEQERAGITMLTDGEQGRQHFVHGFLAGIDGVDFTKMVRKGIRADRYEAQVPTVTGSLRRRMAVHAPDAAYARTLTQKQLKVTIPGPMTIVDTVHDVHFNDRKALAFEFAKLIAEEIHDLTETGVDVVQLDEPAFNVYLDDVEDWGVAALDVAFKGATCTRAVHVCYGYGITENLRWKAALGDSWDQYARILPLLSQSSVDHVSIELAGSHVPPEVLSGLKGKRAAVGVIDVASEQVETPDEVRRTIELALGYLPPAAVIASTNCGMAPMRRDLAYAKLRSLGQGAALARDSIRSAG